jgi:copper chaperone
MTASTPTLKTTTLRSDEFSCPSCIQKIETKLNGLDGVESAEVKFSSGRIIAQHDPQKVSVRDLVNAVAEVGYTAKPSAI